MRQHGLQFPAGPGFLCILFQTYIFQKCVAMADNFNLTCYFFLTLQYGWLRSRGSTHRSYWRAGGTITFSFLPFHFACPKFIQDAGCKTTSHPSFSECCCVEQETPHMKKWPMRTVYAAECATCNLVAWARDSCNIAIEIIPVEMDNMSCFKSKFDVHGQEETQLGLGESKHFAPISLQTVARPWPAQYTYMQKEVDVYIRIIYG